jgi:hypothetical protein
LDDIPNRYDNPNDTPEIGDFYCFLSGKKRTIEKLRTTKLGDFGRIPSGIPGKFGGWMSGYGIGGESSGKLK